MTELPEEGPQQLCVQTEIIGTRMQQAKQAFIIKIRPEIEQLPGAVEGRQQFATIDRPAG